MSNFTICCVSRLEASVLPFLKKISDWCKETNSEFLLGVDGTPLKVESAFEFTNTVLPVKSLGYIESVLDSVIDNCTGDYIFRLDDDEFFSEGLSTWLKENLGRFTESIYNFPRYNLWKDEKHFIPGLYPDEQIRLATKAKSYGRTVIHCGSPFGYGQRINHEIMHYKFLIKTYEDRLKQAESIDAIMTGSGLGSYLINNLPETFYRNIGIEVPYHEITENQEAE